MKLNIPIIARLIVASCLLQTVFADAEIKSGDGGTMVPALLSNDVQSVIVSLPDIEKLWPQHPQTYFMSANRASRILSGVANDPGARQALLNLFSNMIQKTCPTNGTLAVSCVEEKCKAVLYYLNFEEVREGTSKLAAIAKFIGEIRAQIIPGFTPKTVYVNPRNDLSLSPQQLQKAIEENERNKTVNDLQQTLRATNSKLTFHLLHNVNRISRASENNDFIQQIVSSAHLNEEEQRLLK